MGAVIQITETVYRMLLDNLHITYELDESGEQRIRNEAMSGIAYIRKYCSPDADCEPGTEWGQLLCEYVLRAESGALATFEEDFAQDILQGKVLADVTGYAEAMGYEKD